MSLFHRHKWVEVSRTYTEPLTRELKANWISEAMMSMLIMGVTIIELKCSECGDLKHIEVVGKT